MNDGLNDEAEAVGACSNMPQFWAIQYLTLPSERIAEGRRATALNFVSGPDGLLRGWEDAFEKVLARLEGAEQKSKVVKLRSVDDGSG